MDQEVKDEIETFLRTGFYTRAEVNEIICEEVYEPGELDSEEVESAIDEIYARLLAEQRTWPPVTDCDLLDRVFAALNRQGIIALQNAGYTQSDGYDDVREEYHNAPNKSAIWGYCFYHGQDLERVIADGLLLLAFGPIDPKLEETEGPRVGQAIVAELKKVGFAVKWDGTFTQRIAVEGIDWKRRVPEG